MVEIQDISINNFMVSGFKLIEAEWRIYPSVYYATIGSANDLWPGWHWAVIWTNADILFIGPAGINFSDISIEIHTLLFKKNVLENVVWKKWRQFCLHLNVLTCTLY